MSWRENIIELRRKGNLGKENMEQYLRITYLKGDEKYTPKASIEIGKIIDDKYGKPISFRTDRPEDLAVIFRAFIGLMMKMGYSKDEIEGLLMRGWDHGNRESF